MNSHKKYMEGDNSRVVDCSFCQEESKHYCESMDDLEKLDVMLNLSSKSHSIEFKKVFVIKVKNNEK
ncbi:hypothetical protein BTO06_00980 [Tenacibaculum sp. SZ-18]|uniref:hypothetical protein n=1 Tax=Tenacibaculum sp. SZ-18 TaxID=754423 RepID=UPI000C2D125F|nr:hypothetical protein [Tenacibaculum sp. SZ-18]AUC13807.1 hypothetical protein BTO06_00980 [Tenacibaculum sp. SZ-18]